MRRRMLLLICLITLLLPAPAAWACGGLFCTTIPTDQAAERIIFAVNAGASTIDAYVQINYTGSPDQFAWVVPVPNPPTLGVVDMPLFTELDQLTQPNYIAPPLPDTCAIPMPAASSDGGVNVLGQGSVGPYDYAVVGSSDPQALVQWLRSNGYQITPPMEPLVAVYVQEKMDFLAMKLQPDKGTQDIQPIKMTYRSTKPMIPLRLTAVAANPDMGVLTWVLAQSQAEPENYKVMRVANDEIVFSLFSGNNYPALVSQHADEAGGRAFITEYAGPTSALRASDSALDALLRQYPYITRVYTRISPEEMTVDPVFRFNPALPDVSNIHDLRQDARLWDCENYANRASSRAAVVLDAVTGGRGSQLGTIALAAVLLLGLGFGAGRLMRRRR
ncbi:MAG: DUF2330 domain-containing protein [Kouleothrix sp.]|nr:DUF2330 domain-containing protein [Kouleothrix sp.]